MRRLPLLLLAVAALCAEDAAPGGDNAKPHRPSREALQALIEKAFAAADTDSSGTLTRAEFTVAAETYRASRPAPPPKADDGKEAPPAPPKASAETLDKAFAAADANTDAALDKAEFAAALKALRPPRAGRNGDKPGKPGDAPPPAPVK